MAAADMAHACSFEPSPPSIRAARRFVAGTLESTAFAAAANTALLLASELATNAVVHANTEYTVEVAMQKESVRVAVRDGSPTAPRLLDVAELAGSGRGLHLVDALADRWGFDRDGDGKRVWFELAR